MTIMAMLLGIAIFYARPAYRGTTQVRQPDGTMLTIRLVGDEYLSYNTTEDGYSLVCREDGSYVYASLDANAQLEATSLLAHDAQERTADELRYLQNVGKLRPQMRAEMSLMRSHNLSSRRKALGERRKALYDYAQFRGLVILVEYNDKPFRYADYADIMDEMINGDDYTGNNRTNFNYGGSAIRCTGSMRDYYRDNSDGIFVPSFDVVGPVKIDRSQYYAQKTDNAVQLMYDACTAADSIVDFRDYDTNGDGSVDMIYFIFSGLGSYIQGNDSRLLWPHQFDISYGMRNPRKDGVKLGRYACSTELFGNSQWSVLEGIGTMCHEFSHVLGLPDFYDTNNEYEDECVNPDAWSLMANGADLNYGRTPCGFSLFERYALGFASPQVISEPGSFSLSALHSSNTGYRLNTQQEGETFYIENRQQKKWDAALPGHGMLIFRVDSTNTSVWEYSNTVNDNPQHPYYELLRAGGVRSDGYSVSAATASDPFPGTKGVTSIDNTTTPNLKTWTGKLSLLGLRNIKEKSGEITFDAYDVNVLTSIKFEAESYAISVGNSLQLDIVREPETAPFELQFASDNEQVATVDDSGSVTAEGIGEAHITVTANDSITATCLVTVTELREVADIASFVAMEEGEKAQLSLADAQVLYVYGDDIYVRDTTGCLVLHDTGLKVSRNDVLNGDVFGQLSVSNRMPQLTPVEGVAIGSDLSIVAGETVQPVELYGDELTPAHYGDLVLVKGLTLVRNSGIYAEIGDSRVRLWNKFQIKSPKISLPSNIDGKFYDVLAIYGTDVLNGAVIDEFYVLQSPTLGEDPNADGIAEVSGTKTGEDKAYNLSGLLVDGSYKGIVVKAGKKFLQR